MTKAEFLRAEYETLRKEIEQSKDRIFKTLILGVTLVPTAQFLGEKHKIDILLLGMPLLVLVLALIFLAENQAIMRCGRYILLRIEPTVDEDGGWERWLTLSDTFDRRSVDRLLAWSFYLLFALYYAVSVFLATQFAYGTYGPLPRAIVLGLYVVLGLCFGAFLLAKMLVSTTTTSKPVAKPKKATG
jgi:hypothetical protein